MDNFHFFQKGFLGQWYPAPMHEDGITYSCAEQYMMYQKAILFKDYESAGKILKENSPSAQRLLGREVKNFDYTVWNTHKERIVYRGNFLKFTQHSELRNRLKELKDYELVEAAPWDSVWGIGLGPDDPLALDKSTWKGQNLLGQILTNLMHQLCNISFDFLDS